ncbi:type IV pilin-like G/H family protein [[Leptolyngbya] sp. PCC 7376]|uniref:type IV pilin-like G/H family protein n=1 Tax=[Leptolyngbya] sp. PCC 7376 TaxID=111781 RepID=UPI0009004FF3|nr:type IV pilin-like G/H family protein [[Leptolyngbya] sp. PCC 7376]
MMLIYKDDKSNGKYRDNNASGFTLIELLVVIIMIGILGAIALPAFLSQAAKARQSEAKSFVGAINRAQQAYMMERLEFADSVERLDLVRNKKSQYYSYSFVVTQTQGSVVAIPLVEDTGKTYTGAATLYQNKALVKTIICESPQQGSEIQKVPEWDATNSALFCPDPMNNITN